MLWLDLSFNSGPGEKQICCYLSIHVLTAAEIHIMHRNLSCFARVVLILKAFVIPENFQKWSTSDSKLLPLLSIYYRCGGPNLELMQHSWFFCDVSEINFALLTLVFLSKLCWNTLFLCRFLLQGKHTCSALLRITILMCQTLLFSLQAVSRVPGRA